MLAVRSGCEGKLTNAQRPNEIQIIGFLTQTDTDQWDAVGQGGRQRALQNCRTQMNAQRCRAAGTANATQQVDVGAEGKRTGWG